MKILFITRAYGEQAGGMERLSYELIRALSERSDIDPIVLANETRAGASLLAARLRSAAFALTVIPRAVSTARTVDVVHLGDPVQSLAGWLIRLIWRKPVFITVHGLDVEYSNPLYQLYLRLFFRSFSEYVAISAHARAALKRHHVRGKVHVISPGISDSHFDPSYTRSDLKWIQHLPENAFLLLTVGRLVRRKGHAWFIRHVLPRLPEQTHYIIAGSGPEQQRIIDTATQSDVQHRVHLLGRVPDERIKMLYNVCNIFVQPNIPVKNDAEGFGLVLLEAALCERIVVAANIDGIPTAIHNGKNGVLLLVEDPAAWIRALTGIISSSDGSNIPSGAEARDYTLKTFSWPTIAEQYVNLFKAKK